MKIVFFLILFLYAVYIGYRIATRMARDKDPDGQPGCVLSSYVTLIYLCMCLFSFPFIGWTGTALYQSMAHDRYEATITSVREYEDEDDDGNYRTMYQPTVKFTANNGTVIERELGISSGDPYDIGEMHPVSYDADSDQVNSRSWSTILLLTAGLMLSLMFLGYVLIGFAYAYDIPIGITGTAYTVYIFLYILFPLGMIGMNVALIYYLVDTIINGNNADDPVWVLWLVGFFVLVLTLSMIGIIRMILEKRKNKIQTL